MNTRSLRVPGAGCDPACSAEGPPAPPGALSTTFWDRTLEVDRIGRRLPRRDERGKLGCAVLPHQQHRALGRIALVPDVGRHGRHVSGFHDDPGPAGPRVPVLDRPVDLVAQLHEPLHPIVPVDDGQNVLLGGRTVQAVLAHGDDRGVPRHVGAGQVGEQVERAHLTLEAGLGDDLGLILRHVEEVAVDREPVRVGPERLVTGDGDHSLRRDSAPIHGRRVVTVLGTEGRPRLVGTRERIEGGIRPVLEYRLEGSLDHRGLEVLHVVELGLPVGVVVPSGEQVDGTVVVDGADHPIEVDNAVEELPGHVALEGAQEGIGRRDVAARRPFDVHEVLVAAEGELPQGEAPVTVLVGLGGLDCGNGLTAHGASLLVGICARRAPGSPFSWSRGSGAALRAHPHRIDHLHRGGCHSFTAPHIVWQMSAHRYCVSALAMVCRRTTPGRSAWNWYAAPAARSIMWPRRARMTPIFRPAGPPGRRIEPSVRAGTAEGSASLTRRTSTRPSITRANSSWAAARHSDVPSARMTSSTYCMFLPTATLS